MKDKDEMLTVSAPPVQLNYTALMYEVELKRLKVRLVTQIVLYCLVSFTSP